MLNILELKPLFVDVDSLTGNISFKYSTKKLTRRLKDFIIVHMTGISADLKKIVKYCKQRNIKLIEDCAHALGTYSKNLQKNFCVYRMFFILPNKTNNY